MSVLIHECFSVGAVCGQVSMKMNVMMLLAVLYMVINIQFRAVRLVHSGLRIYLENSLLPG